jgi:DNA topoisomerase-1
LAEALKTTGKTTPSGAKVPPAWTDVWVADDPQNCIQATGRDSKGRRVYLYSAEYMGRAAAAKFTRLKAFLKVYPAMVRKFRRDMRTKDEALVLYLISKTGFRIGSNSETLARVKAFGASTLRCHHVAISANRVSFDFTGKKGVRVTKTITDRFLAGEIGTRCQSMSDRPLFNTTNGKIRAYLCAIPSGSPFSVKDFRTYLGTAVAFRKIKTLPVPKSGAEYKRYRKEVGETVAKQLGNSRAIALKSYVSPEVFCSWDSKDKSVPDKVSERSSSLRNNFLECIHYDQEVSMEEFHDTDPLEKRE